MRAKHRHEREYEKNFADADEHKNKLNCVHKIASQIQVSEIQTSVPLGSKSNSGIKSASARWMQPHEVGLPMEFWSAVPWM